MSRRVTVCSTDELEPGERTTVTIDGREIGVLNVDGTYFALENACRHEGGPVCEGRVHAALEGEYRGPGQRVKEDYTGPPAIACPWHGWEYDLETGEHLGDRSVALETFDVVVDDRTIHVEV